MLAFAFNQINLNQAPPTTPEASIDLAILGRRHCKNVDPKLFDSITFWKEKAALNAEKKERQRLAREQAQERARLNPRPPTDSTIKHFLMDDGHDSDEIIGTEYDLNYGDNDSELPSKAK